MQSYNHLNNHVNNEDECDSRDQVMEDVFIHVFKTIFYDYDLFFVVVHIFQEILYIEFLCIYIYFIS